MGLYECQTRQLKCYFSDPLPPPDTSRCLAVRKVNFYMLFLKTLELVCGKMSQTQFVKEILTVFSFLDRKCID